ncbi:MAG: hypothetical protein ACUVSY_08980 [Roseiflexus sp.]
MSVTELHRAIPLRITRGAILRSDGCAVGLVTGGAPSWDLRSRESKARLAETYHRILLAQDAPIDIYIIDGPPDLEHEMTELYRRSDQSKNPTLTAVLDDMVTFLEECAGASAGRHRQTIWAIACSNGLTSAGPWALGSLWSANSAARATSRVSALLTEAVERARRLADALMALGGSPQPRLPEPEEIVRLWFRLVDPVRAARYPLQGALLERIRSVVQDR